MNIDTERLSLLQSLTAKHRGVFSTYDLANLFLTSSPLSFNRRLKPFLSSGILRRFCRGFYVAKDFDLEWLSQRLGPQSALSLGTVLAKHRLIGNIPQKTVYAVKIGKTRLYESSFGTVVHLGYASRMVGRNLWFGYDVWDGAVRLADPEKAFLDTLYFYQLGHKFSFNVYSDIATEKLNKKQLKTYLGRYRNPKFKAFVKGVLDGQRSIG